MSSILGAKAISLVQAGQVSERGHARVFNVKDYVVVIGARPLEHSAPRDVCTCQAGQRGVRCSHIAAVKLQMARERDEARS
jgi:uncharacterized Zn finger protein